MTDRFTAWKAQRQQDVPTSERYEMTGLDGNGLSQNTSALYPETASIQDGIAQFNNNITRISELRSQSLNAIQDPSPEEVAQLDALVSNTRVLSRDLKQRISALNSPPASAQDAQIRRNHAKLLSSKFIEALQNYQKAEQQYRAKYKDRVERQFKIVNPRATPEEVAAVVEEQSGGKQIFAQALSSSTRSGDSRAAYREVQERHQDIRKMEETLAELGQLFEDMETIVKQQELTISNVMETAGKVEEHTGAALEATDNAVKFAISARKKKWFCFFIFVIMLIAVIALVLGLLHYYRII